MREKDHLMDQFVDVTNQLDEALLNFNLANFSARQSILPAKLRA